MIRKKLLLYLGPDVGPGTKIAGKMLGRIQLLLNKKVVEQQRGIHQVLKNAFCALHASTYLLQLRMLLEIKMHDRVPHQHNKSIPADSFILSTRERFIHYVQIQPRQDKIPPRPLTRNPITVLPQRLQHQLARVFVVPFLKLRSLVPINTLHKIAVRVHRVHERFPGVGEGWMPQVVA